MYLGHPNDLEPRTACPFDGEDADTAEAAGSARKDEIDTALATFPMDFAQAADIVEVVGEFIGFAPNGSEVTISNLVAAMSCAYRMDYTGCARYVEKIAEAMKASEASRAESARQLEIDSEEVMA